MKYQFQFAGANVSRSNVQQRKWVRMALLAGVLLLAALAYWQYMFRMTHGKIAPGTVVRTVAVAAPASAASAPAPVADKDSTLPPALKKAADAGAAAVGNMVADSVKLSVPMPSPTAPVATPVAEPQAVAAPVPAALPFKIVPTPSSAHRVPRVLTPEQQMTVAAQTAMDNMLKLANKYPDAYGFAPMDVFEEAKLGQPIQIYTVAEQDRIAYQAGQPVKPILKPAKQWVYPVLAGERICCMVQVSKNGTEYIPGNASKSLALAWNKINELWPADEGYHPMLVVNSRIPGYYFTVPEAAQPNITDTVQLFYYNPSLSPADVILASWR